MTLVAEVEVVEVPVSLNHFHCYLSPPAESEPEALLVDLDFDTQTLVFPCFLACAAPFRRCILSWLFLCSLAFWTLAAALAALAATCFCLVLAWSSRLNILAAIRSVL